MGITVGNSVGQNEGSVEGSVVGLPVGTVVVGVSVGANDTDGALLGRLDGPDVGVSKSDDDIILLVSFNCSDRWSCAIYDESNTRFNFIRVIDKS